MLQMDRRLQASCIAICMELKSMFGFGGFISSQPEVGLYHVKKEYRQKKKVLMLC